VTMRCLHNWRKEGRIPYWRVTARCFRYDLSAVERALAKPDELEE
jgi:predicted site-specific integrase-resolvase